MSNDSITYAQRIAAYRRRLRSVTYEKAAARRFKSQLHLTSQYTGCANK